jgi:ribosomal protein L44E
MKLTRNKIRKIRKQQHQSVRKWKKARNSIRRKVATFRRSPLDLIPKRKNVFNKTLKKYIPLPVLEYLKEKYLNMRKMRRKQRRERLMIGGATAADATATATATATAIAAMALDLQTTQQRHPLPMHQPSMHPLPSMTQQRQPPPMIKPPAPPHPLRLHLSMMIRKNQP